MCITTCFHSKLHKSNAVVYVQFYVEEFQVHGVMVRQSYPSRSAPPDIPSMHLAPFLVTTMLLTRFPKLHFTSPELFWDRQFVLLNPFTFLFAQPPILFHSGTRVYNFLFLSDHTCTRQDPRLCSPGTLGRDCLSPAMAPEARGQFAAIKRAGQKEDQDLETLSRNRPFAVPSPLYHQTGILRLLK